jgi:hypothetical protein
MRDLTKALAARYAVAMGANLGVSDAQYAASLQSETKNIISAVTGVSTPTATTAATAQQQTSGSSGSVSWLISESNTPNQAKVTRVNALNAKTVNYLKRVLECSDVKVCGLLCICILLWSGMCSAKGCVCILCHRYACVCVTIHFTHTHTGHGTHGPKAPDSGENV